MATSLPAEYHNSVPWLALGPSVTKENLGQALPTIPITCLPSWPHSFPQSPQLEFFLLEGDLRALGQPMSSVLELGIDLAYLNCTLQPHHFQPLVT